MLFALFIIFVTDFVSLDVISCADLQSFGPLEIKSKGQCLVLDQMVCKSFNMFFGLGNAKLLLFLENLQFLGQFFFSKTLINWIF